MPGAQTRAGYASLSSSAGLFTSLAVANAVEDAIGVRVTELPVSAEKVYEALQARQAGR